MSLLRLPFLHHLGWLLLLVLSSCSTEQVKDDYYAFRALHEGRWSREEPYAFDLLFTEREESLATEVILRMDSRLDHPKARVETRLSFRGEVLRIDTLDFSFAPCQGAWERPGIIYHDFSRGLAQPLHTPHTGLFVLEVALLDSFPLEGVAQLGIHTHRQRPQQDIIKQ